MPKNVMKMMKPSPNYGRNDFDLSHRTVHDANFGELIPTFCVETVPKDKIRIKVSDLVRAQPMVTSPFLRAKQHIDVWFVPYNMMWSRFNEFISDKDEPSSSALHDRLFVPHVTFNELYAALSYYKTTSSALDIHGIKNLNTVLRNLDLLGYSGTFLNGEIEAGTQNYANLSVNLWRLWAYNLIWYREYRQQYYDDGKNLLPSAISAQSGGAAYLFSGDILQCSTSGNSDPYVSFLSDGAQYLAALMQPRYRCWKKDLYTGLMPNSQFGNVSSVDAVIESPVTLVNNESGYDLGLVNSKQIALEDSGGNIVSGSGSWQIRSNNLGRFAQTSFDILTLRKKEAIQRWRENALRAGNQIQDNFEAHYGVKPASHMDVHPKHVASFDAPLNIGDINAQAQTGSGMNQALGDVAGKGIMSFGGNEAFEFETNDFGVLMGIYSILPEAEYDGNNLDRMNALLEREDYFFPEYENLGLELVDSSNISMNQQYNFGLGYAPRYFGYKQKMDRCVGEFMQYQGFSGIFKNWCSPKYDVDFAVSGGNLPLSTLYVNPAIFNVNFSANFNTVPQFLVDMYVDCAAIRQMSVSGMPSY